MDYPSDRLLADMEPGAWYTVKELEAYAGPRARWYLETLVARRDAVRRERSPGTRQWLYRRAKGRARRMRQYRITVEPLDPHEAHEAGEVVFETGPGWWPHFAATAIAALVEKVVATGGRIISIGGEPYEEGKGQ